MRCRDVVDLFIFRQILLLDLLFIVKFQNKCELLQKEMSPFTSTFTFTFTGQTFTYIGVVYRTDISPLWIDVMSCNVM